MSILLRGGHRLDFACAAGALAYAGEGYPWEWPLRWAGYVRPREITVISKTLTYFPTRGNLRWWCPWRCVRPLGGGSFVNAVGLTNPGYRWWIENRAAWAHSRGHKVIASIAPTSESEASAMAADLAECRAVVGIQLNVSCPNVRGAAVTGADDKLRATRNLLEVMQPVRQSLGGDVPLILKLGVADPIEGACRTLGGLVDAFEVINTVPWKLYAGPSGKEKSPLARYGLEGGVSGPAIRHQARYALIRARSVTAVPIISGGAIDSLDEVRVRHGFGADAFAIGSLFLARPWRPRKIIEEARRLGYGQAVRDAATAQAAAAADPYDGEG